jgi:predicted alpha/beta superfamily hydrolase
VPGSTTSAEWRDYHDPSVPGDPQEGGRLKVLEKLHSPQLDNTRDLLVYLPPTYDIGDRRYPVLYMHDGQNLFDPATSFAGDWGVLGTMQAGSRRGLEAIVVGIPNTGPERFNEYSPFVDEEHGGGKGDDYLRFIIETIKPIIDRDFNTFPDRAHTGLAGSSLGGLISVYGFFRFPEAFGFAGVMSPALWYADREIFPWLVEQPFVPGKIYLDVGTKEGKQTLVNVRQLQKLLLEKGYRPGLDLLYVEETGAGHSESAWARRLRKTIPFLLRRIPPIR